jgi:ElaB/YqjD/DUF883 family membrane-anchored ribosome-binding protein
MDQANSPGIKNDYVNEGAAMSHDAVNQTAEKLSAGVNRLRDAAHEMVDGVADRASKGTAWANENVDQFKQKQAEFTRAAGDLISARPWVAVGSALLVGYLVGRFRR